MKVVELAGSRLTVRVDERKESRRTMEHRAWMTRWLVMPLTEVNNTGGSTSSGGKMTVLVWSMLVGETCGDLGGDIEQEIE